MILLILLADKSNILFGGIASLDENITITLPIKDWERIINKWYGMIHFNSENEEVDDDICRIIEDALK
ncbi:hypothetical protein [Paenibacillus sp. A3]|uniref:hypothetical protein n=1 Tax=Paenibacillus sp. A3 TaxID=1337054 RepID=UPI000A7D4BD0|nr:hypothetical protein [Paenibacillus sp. A3]